jgi:hypothetical protein
LPVLLFELVNPLPKFLLRGLVLSVTPALLDLIHAIADHRARQSAGGSPDEGALGGVARLMADDSADQRASAGSDARPSLRPRAGRKTH